MRQLPPCQYDKQAKQLVYVKGEEGACVYCHKNTMADNVIASKEASHYQCIGCHRDNMAKNKRGRPDQLCGLP
jgi:predicted CXXCH cytochrome family protein